MKFNNDFNLYEYIKPIVVLGLAYASVIIFPAFGPVLLKISNSKEIIFLSIIALIFLSVGFLLPPGIFIGSFKNKNTLNLLSTASFMTIVLGFYNNVFIRSAAIVLIVVTAGRIVYFWSRDFFIDMSLNIKGRIIAYSLFIAYGILYICNALVPSLPTPIVLLISPMLLLISSLLLQQTSIVNQQIPIEASEASRSKAGFMCFLAFCIYITAGITYGGVYPTFIEFKYIDRYYNVFPFLIAAAIAGHIADVKGRKYLLYIGLSLLGISFAFFAVTMNTAIYFVIQTSIQAAWAFLDIYIWVVFADLAFNKQKSILYTLGLSSIMMGVALGAVISFIFSQISVPNLQLFTFAAHLPLFFAVALLHRVPETLSNKLPEQEAVIQLAAVEDFNAAEQIAGMVMPPAVEVINTDISLMEQLTPREKEVFNLLIKGKENSEICKELHISNNTVKTHVRNIYRKLEVGSRKELKALMRN